MAPKKSTSPKPSAKKPNAKKPSAKKPSAKKSGVQLLDDDAFIAMVEQRESAIYQQTSEELVAWQTKMRLGQRLRPTTITLTEVD